MNFQDVIGLILPPQAGNMPGVTTGSDGIRQDYNATRKRGKHGGVDINYAGVGQNGINLTHPEVGSPVTGTVVDVSPREGLVVIRDDQGNLHEIRHLYSTAVEKNDTVTAGQNIGTMGGRDPVKPGTPGSDSDNGSDPHAVPQHVDYKVKNSDGKTVDPEKFWNEGQRPGTSQATEQIKQTAITAAATSPPRYDPIVLDLDGDGVETAGLKAGAYFDHDGNGFAEQTGWVAPDDGLLVWDRNGDGLINDGKELFGDQTILSNGTQAANGFQALAELDDNGDGKIDASDVAYVNLQVWQDTDGDGFSTTDELFTLPELGIQSLNTTSALNNITDPQGNTQTRLGSFTRTDGSTGDVGDYLLKRDPTFSLAEQWLEVPADIAALPDVPGSGTVYDLHQAMVRDTSGTLRVLVESFATETNPGNRAALVEQFLFKWTSSDGINPTSRGPFIDARRLSVLEKFLGQPYVGMPDGTARIPATNPTATASPLVNQAYQGVAELVYAQLMAQTHLQDIYRLITYAFDDSTQALTGGLSAVTTELQSRLAADPVSGTATLSEFVRTLRGLQAEGQMDFARFRETFAAQSEELQLIIDEAGRQVVTGTSASETVYGQAYADAALVAGAGHDSLFAGSGSDALLGQAGDDVLFAGNGDDLLDGGAGNDTLRGWNGADLLIGGAGNDSLQGERGNDTYVFTRGAGQDTILDDDPTPDNVDTIVLGADILPADVSAIRIGDDLQLALNGTTDTLTVKFAFRSTNNRVERIAFADGTVLDGAALMNQVTPPTEGNDILFGGPGADVLDGLGGHDALYGLGGNDTLIGGTGHDSLVGGTGTDSLDGGVGNDTLYGSQGNDTLSGGDGDDYMTGDTGSWGSVGGHDTLSGGAGNDTLIGEGGNDIIDGGQDNDSLVGVAGNDTYLFGRGGGQDTVYDFDRTVGNTDTIQFASDLTPDDVRVQRAGDDLVLAITDTPDTLTVQSWFRSGEPGYLVERVLFADGTAWDVPTIKLKALEGTDGADFLLGYGTADTLNGLGGDDFLLGAGGDDTLDGGPGNDTLIGGSGFFTVEAGTGNDTYRFGRGSGHDTVWDADTAPGNMDTIVVNADVLPADVTLTRRGDDLVLSIPDTGDRITVTSWFLNESPVNQVEHIAFADGTMWDVPTIKNLVIQSTPGDDRLIGYGSGDTLNGNAGNDILVGRGGDDILDGGSGNDTLSGGTDSYYGDNGNGNDTYLFGRGSGQDTIVDRDLQAGNIDTILLAPDVLPGDVTLKRSGDSLVLAIDATFHPDGETGRLAIPTSGDVLTVQGWFWNDSSEYQVERIQFADGTVWDPATVQDLVTQATEGDDVLIGAPGANALDGLGGNDLIYGRAGADTVIGGTGNDAVIGEAGADQLWGGEGHDFLEGGSGDDILEGELGDDVLAGGVGNDVLRGGGESDRLFGDGGGDTLDGGGGNDTLFGGTGDDTYLFGRGFGADQVIDDDSTAGNTDTIQMAADVLPSDVTLRRSGNDLALTITDTGDSLTVASWFLNESPVNQVEQIAFADGTTWDVPTIQGLVLQGTAGDDTLIGYASDDLINGQAGNDTLTGGVGNDTLLGGAGSDLLIGGTGNDTYLFGRGSGQDTILDQDTTPGNSDALVLNADVLPTDVTLRRRNDDLVLSIPDSGDAVTVQNWFADPAHQVETVQFADGTVWDGAFITGAVLQGTAGDDTLIGYALDDLLDGGTGADTLIGKAGNDTYVFDVGYGNDTILDQDATPGNLDTIQMGAGIAPSDLTVRRIAGDLVFTVNGTTDSLRVQNWFAPDSLVEQVQFADGTVWDDAFIQSIVSQPTDSDDFLVGTDGADVLDGGGGNDVIDGAAGNDSLYGGMGSDTLLGGEGEDTLDGGADADSPAGGSGAGVFVVGAGNDWLAGGAGADTYRINLGGGFDQIVDQIAEFDPTTGVVVPVDNILVFGSGITPDTLSVQAYFDGTLAIGLGNEPCAETDDGVLILGEGEALGGPAVTRFQFADGTELTLDEMLAKADGGVLGDQFGSFGADVLVGSAFTDFIEGFEGDDQIHARANSDTVFGDDGNDLISAGAGADFVDGGAGDDVIAGGSGADVLQGGAGSDVYALNRGDGADMVLDHAGVPGSPDVDSLSFGHGITPQDLRAYVDPSGNLVLLAGGEDRIDIPWFDAANGFAEIETQRIERAQFFDGPNARVFDLAGVVGTLSGALLAADAATPVSLFTTATAGFELTGTVAGGEHAAGYATQCDLFAVSRFIVAGPGDDVLAGTPFGDTIDAGDGNNVVNAGDGPNMVAAGAGNDVITAGSGDDTITAGDGNNVIQAGGGNNVVTTGVGADTVTTGAGQDVISAGAGDDALNGGAGDDTYAFKLGDAVDTIQDAAAPGEGNQIVFGAGIAASDLTLTVDQNALVIQVGTGGDALRLANFDPNDSLDPHAVDTFRFADGTVLSYHELLGQGFDFIGTEGDDVLLGTGAVDRITGFGGDDVIAAGAGSDVLDGGSGNDTYVFNLGDGVDTITDGTAPGAGNWIQFGPGITSADISLSIDQDTLVVTIGAGGDAIRFPNFDSANLNGPHAVETFAFSDGGTLSFSQLLARGFVFTGTAGNDTVVGTSARDTFNGLTGGDALAGGLGDDTYMFNLGDGVDTVDDLAEIGEGNTLSFGSGITLADLRLSVDQNRDALIVTVGAGGDAARLANFDSGNVAGPHAVEFYSFADGTTLTYDQLIARGFDLTGTTDADSLTGTNANDRIQGVTGDDTMAGGAGDDVLTGGPGDTTYLFNLGDGVDVIDDLATADIGNTLVFGEGITPDDLVLSPGAGELVITAGSGGDAVHLTNFDLGNADLGPHAIETFQFADGTVLTYEQLVARTFIIQGDSQDDVVIGTNVSDRLYGYEGSDLLDGGLGNDTLTGGIGNDVLIGGTGNNTYAFNFGDGQDVVHDVVIPDAGNQILFGAGLTQADLTFEQQSGALIIHYGSEGDTIQLADFDPTGANGTLVVETIRFADDSTLSLRDLFAPANAPPVVANPITDQATAEDTTFNFAVPSGTFADPNAGDTLTLSTLLESGNPLPTWLSFDATTGTFSGTPTNGDVGSVNVTVTATDSGNLSASDIFALTVTNMNDAPMVANATIDQSTEADVFFSVVVPANTFADVDAGDTLALSASLETGDPLPAWLAFDAATGTFSGTPEDNDVGALSVKVTATDTGDLSAADMFGLTVTPAPVHVTVGTNGDDVITGVGRDDIDARGGDDLVHAGVGNDTVRGGKGEDQLFGETGDDALYGNKGDDLLDGGAGDDFLKGGKGDDTLLGGPGDDTLQGGKGDDILRGGAGDDLLKGGKGKDTLQGGPGDDVLDTGKGDDTILFGRGDGHDALVGRDHNHGDEIEFGPGVAIEHLWFQQSGHDLIVRVLGTSSQADQLTIADWYTDKKHRVDEFQTADGHELEDKRVDQLVQAMAAFAPPALSADLTLPPDIQQQLAPALAAAWEHGHS